MATASVETEALLEAVPRRSSLVVVKRGDGSRGAPRPPPPSSRNRPRQTTLLGLAPVTAEQASEVLAQLPRTSALLPDADWSADTVLVDWDEEPYVERIGLLETVMRRLAPWWGSLVRHRSAAPAA